MLPKHSAGLTVVVFLVCLGLRFNSSAIGLQKPVEKLSSKSANLLFGRALSYDWNFEQHRLPPMRETIELHEKSEVANGVHKLTIEFLAFGKLWTMRLQRNNVLLDANATFETRDRDGKLLARHEPPTNGCFYIGTVDINENERGLVSVTTCNNSTRALVITNANDYVLFPWDWKVPLHLRQGLRHQRSLEQDEPANAYVIEIANLTAYRTHVERLLWQSRHGRSRRQPSRENFLRFPRFHPLKEPPGRLLYFELGLVMDKWYIADFARNISSDKADLIIHAAELINNAQLWYLHPTFGFQMWLLVRGVTFIYDDIGDVKSDVQTSFIDSSCRWVTSTLPGQENWDAVLLLSSKEGIWNNRVGLSQRAGVCSMDGAGRCSGVSNVKFQMASLARLTAHELVHPLGVADDYEGTTSEACYSGIMRQGVWQDHDWSVCSIQELERWLEITTSHCVRPSSMNNLPSSIPIIAANVAWRARAVQSSTYWSATAPGRGTGGARNSGAAVAASAWGAWKATDGGVAGLPVSYSSSVGEEFGSCTQTREEDEPWLRVELEPRHWLQPIHFVHIYNRDDCCSERLRDFEVRIGFEADFRKNSLCYFYNGTVPGGRYGMAVIQCPVPMKGRYISVQIKQPKSILTICEIQIFQDVRLLPFDSSNLTCVDRHPFCPYWSSMGECVYEVYRKFMEANCSYSCGMCERASVPSWSPPMEYAPPAPHNLDRPPVVPALTSNCRDQHEHCLHIAANGDCHVTFEMPEVCALSCGFCHNTNNYVRGTQPGPFLVIGGTFLTSLPTTSSVLTTPTAQTFFNASQGAHMRCVDSKDLCSFWQHKGYCLLKTIQALCLLTCGLCGDLKNITAKANSAHTTASSHGLMRTSSIMSIPLQETHVPSVLTTHVITSWRSTTEAATTSIAPKRLTTTLATLPTTHILTTMRQSCVDRHRSCGAWAAAGHCPLVDGVRQACQRSCAVCLPLDTELLLTAPPPPTCRPDKHPSCISWARFGFCYQERVIQVCPTSCRHC